MPENQRHHRTPQRPGLAASGGAGARGGPAAAVPQPGRGTRANSPARCPRHRRHGRHRLRRRGGARPIPAPGAPPRSARPTPAVQRPTPSPPASERARPGDHPRCRRWRATGIARTPRGPRSRRAARRRATPPQPAASSAPNPPARAKRRPPAPSSLDGRRTRRVRPGRPCSTCSLPRYPPSPPTRAVQSPARAPAKVGAGLHGATAMRELLRHYGQRASSPASARRRSHTRCDRSHPARSGRAASSARHRPMRRTRWSRRSPSSTVAPAPRDARRRQSPR